MSETVGQGAQDVVAGSIMGAMKETVVEKCVLREGSYSEVLSDYYGRVNLVVTSPPYNIGTSGPARHGNRTAGQFDPKSYGSVRAYPDNMPEMEYQDWQRDFISWCFTSLLAPDGVLVYNHKNRHRGSVRGRGLITPYEWILPLMTAGLVVVREEIVWDRGSTHNHDPRYLFPQTERVFVIQRPGDNPFFKNRDIYSRRKGEKRHLGSADVWKIPLISRTKRDCSFPEVLPRECIRMWSRRDSLVCDPFSGSGTVASVCMDTDRRFVGSEIMEDAFCLSVERLAEKAAEKRMEKGRKAK